MYDNEILVDAFIALLQAGIEDALDEVEAEYEDTKPIILPDPVTYFPGHDPLMLERPSVEFPIISVLTGERQPDQNGKAIVGYQAQTVDLFIDFFVVADEKETVNRMKWRYARAICKVLAAQRMVGGKFDQLNHMNPPVSESEAGRHAKTTSANMGRSGEYDYVQMGRISVAIRIGG